MTLHECMLRPFSRWLEPFPDESALGFFRRLVANEEHNSAAVYAREIGLDGDHPDPDEILQAILTLPIADVWKERLRRATPVRRGSSLSLAGEELRPRQWSITARRFCPGCLHEAPYDRTWWDIVPVRLCPFHDEPLVNRDPDGRIQRWWWPYPGESRWGGALARQCPRTESTVSVEKYIVGRLGFGPKLDAPILDAFSLADAIEACSFAGSLVSGKWSDEDETNPEEPLKDAHNDLGFSILCRSRADFVEALRAWVRDEVPAHVRERGFDVVFRAPNVRRRTYLSPMLSEFFRRAMHKAVAAANRREQKPFREEEFHVEDFGVIALAERLGIQQRGVSEIASRVGVMPDRLWPKARVHFAPDEAERIEEFVRGLVTYADAAKILGLPRYQVKPLVDAGFLERIPSIAGRGSRAAGLNRREIHELLLKTMESLPFVSPSGTHSLCTAAAMMGVEAGLLASLAVAGTVRPIGRTDGPMSLCNLRFAPVNDLPPHVRARKKRERDTKRELGARRLRAVQFVEEVGMENACSKLGLRRQTLDLWAKAFSEGGLDALVRLRYEARHPQTTPSKTKDRIRKIALRHPEYGCDRISAVLAKEGTPVSSATVQKVLISAGLGKRADRLAAAVKDFGVSSRR